MAAPSLKNKHFTEVKRLHLDEGMTLTAIGRELGIHPITLGKWFKAEGIPTRQSGYKQQQAVRAAKLGDTKVTRSCRQCGKDFEDYEYRNRAFCSRDCTNDWQRANSDRFHRWCLCGTEVENNPWQNKYCSAECRRKYGKKKQADPAKQVTFTCQNCGEEVTRPRSWGKGYFKYCSNACASRHTKTKKHIVVDDAVVLDSTWEALFWGLCGFLKIPVERFDRDRGVQWSGEGWYAPDFWLPSVKVAVEVKGIEDGDDIRKWITYREQRGLLAVVDRDLLNQLRCAPTLEEFLIQILAAWNV